MSARYRTGVGRPELVTRAIDGFTRAASRRNPCCLACIAVWHRSRSCHPCASRSDVRAPVMVPLPGRCRATAKKPTLRRFFHFRRSRRNNIFLMSRRRSRSHKAASSTQQFPCVPDPLLRPSILSPVNDPLFIFGGHRHAIIRRIRRGLSLFPAFCQFFGIYLVINHDALLLWKKLIRQRAVGVAPITGTTRHIVRSGFEC